MESLVNAYHTSDTHCLSTGAVSGTAFSVQYTPIAHENGTRRMRENPQVAIQLRRMHDGYFFCNHYPRRNARGLSGHTIPMFHDAA